MRIPKAYKKIFSSEFDLGIWPKLVSILRLVDIELVMVRNERIHSGERFLKKWRYLVALLLVARASGKFSFNSKDLAALDLSILSCHAVSEMWQIIQRQPDFDTAQRKKNRLSRQFIRGVCVDAASTLGLADVEAIEKSHPASISI